MPFTWQYITVNKNNYMVTKFQHFCPTYKVIWAPQLFGSLKYIYVPQIFFVTWLVILGKSPPLYEVFQWFEKWLPEGI